MEYQHFHPFMFKIRCELNPLYLPIPSKHKFINNIFVDNGKSRIGIVL